MSNDVSELYLGEWPVSYEWPRIRKTHGSRGGGKSQDQVRLTALQRLIADARKQFWEARHASPVVARAIQAGLTEGLEEAEALLLAVTGLLEENRGLAVNFRTNTAVPFPNGNDSVSSTNYAVGFTKKEPEK